jgi:hypothetical protein
MPGVIIDWLKPVEGVYGCVLATNDCDGVPAMRALGEMVPLRDISCESGN